MAAYCPKCGRTKPGINHEILRTQSVRVLDCECGGKMVMGDPPPEPPDPKRLSKLEAAYSGLTSELEKLDPWPVIQQKEARLREIQPVADTATAVLSDEHLDGVSRAPLDAIAKEREATAAAREQRTALEAEAKRIMSELEPLREARLFHDRAALRKRLTEDLPGDEAAKKAAQTIAKAHTDREAEIKARRDEAARLGMDVPNYKPLPVAVAEAVARLLPRR